MTQQNVITFGKPRDWSLVINSIENNPTSKDGHFWKSVTSSAFNRYRYDSQTQALHIDFGSKVWVYRCTHATYTKFLAFESKGRFLHEGRRGGFLTEIESYTL